MRQIILLGLLLIASSYIVIPKMDSCECSSLLNQSDCISKTGCKWKYTTVTNSTTQSPTLSTTLGSCSNDTNTAIVQTYCSTIMDSTQCSSSIGCAFYNDTCTIFAGCSAYVKTTNAACQAISTQCTTDGFGCIIPTACQSYKIQELCTNNLALSGAKSCNWMNNDNGGTCEDKKCSDAPSSFKTLSQCNKWITGCLTNGIECVSNLSSCSQYQNSNGCIGMIGSEGPCIDSTLSKSCRALLCTDAPSTYSSDTACDNFLKGCLTFGRGCVLFLQPCNTNLQSQGCTDLIGSDGPCVVDITIRSNNCRALACSDAPSSINTNTDCSKFLSGCVTTGQGCTNQLSTCSSYIGTKISCSSYIGTDGKCKKVSSQSDTCLARTCQDAPATINTNSACSSFQLGCVTTGAGCTSSLESCTSYIGTNITCSQYKGNDGNCTAPQNQITSGACYPKICSDAPTYITKNSECQAYSYLCVTNGAGCTHQRSCEATSQAITCKEQSSCSLNQICLNRSTCSNYLTLSQCQLNQQQYSYQNIIYLRPCLWIEKTQTCTNVLCSSLSITLITDASCDSALSGCITNGAGCVDISDPCSSSKGLTEQCQRLRGVNRIIWCSQLNTITDPTTPCVGITQCSEAKSLSLFPLTSITCNQISIGCFFDGKDNCTSGDCTSYFGTQQDCSFISSASDKSYYNYYPEKCWKTINLSDAATPCEKRLCSHAPSYLTNKQCDQFLSECIWNGLDQGGCMEKQINCSDYKGTFSRCSTITTKYGSKCTKNNGFCKPIVCVNKIPPGSASTNILKGSYCQQFVENSNKYNCQMGSGVVQTCVSPLPKSCGLFVAVGEDNASKAFYCQALNYPGQVGCGYIEGDYCDFAACDQFTSYGQTVDLKASYCQGLKVDGTYVQCGLASSSANQCAIRKCTDYGITQESCINYTTNCVWNQLANNCYTKATECAQYQIPASFTTTELSKVKFCSSVISNSVYFQKCSYLFDASTTTCNQIPYHCTDIGIPSAIKSDMDKINFCLNSMSVNHYRCVYSTDRPTSCSDIALCHKYIPYQTPQTDLVNQIFCSKMIESYKRVCGFTTGTNQCLQSQANCSDYDTYGKSIAENQQFCSQLTETTNNKKCASNKSGPSKCKDPACGDITSGQSFETCTSYNIICTFDGGSCVHILAECSGYNAIEFGQGQQANCAALAQTDGKKCGWTSGLNCTSRICSQLKGAGASAASCAAYASDCQYDGQSCVDKEEDCKLYIPQGETDAIKASICNSMNNKNPYNFLQYQCTYVAGQPTCEDTWDSCINRIPSFLTNEQGLAICSLVQSSSGSQCGFDTGLYYCTLKQCSQALISQTDSDCNNYQRGCEIDSNTSCEYDYSDYISCYDAPKTFTTNAACKSYNSYCVTNEAGCIDRRAYCNSYKGNQTMCNRFTGDSGYQPCSNTATASESDECIERTCQQNKTATSDSECDMWYRMYSWRRECVWGGGLGCQSAYDTCDKFIGTVDSCPTFFSFYGPCFGTGTGAKPAPCTPTNSLCTAAPKTYNSNELCKKWGSQCIFDGIGCISRNGLNCSSLQALELCSLNKASYGCDIALSCKTTPSTCDELNNAIECNNTQGLGMLQCGWDALKKKCVSMNCSLLPLTLVTESQCRAAISTCTTGGIGCITKGACSTYPKLACGVASSTDIQKACIWQNSACRPIECTDNTTATTDADCNKFFEGCRNLGIGCQSNITCSQITKASLCIFDSVGYPCLWYKPLKTSSGSCINYAKCSDIISSSHQECQAASELCTTNGITCISIITCSKTILQVSCIIGTDGQCGWMPATSSIPASCQLYTNCQSVQGTTNEQCQLWGKKCISDGKFCIEKSTCATFSTQDSCILGTDGRCFWEPPTENTNAFCRIQICSDSTTNITTHSGCVAYQASTPCTTSGTQCIPIAYCSSYESKAGCLQGTDGVCWWATSQSPTMSTSFCRLKQCTDVQLTQSALCKQEIPGIKCVSNGINCVPQSTCSSYTAREACLGGGSDGVCAFNPGANTTTPNVGTCSLFTQCSHANSDQIACNSRSDACYFNLTTVNGTITSSCTPHTCTTKAQGTSCQPVPSWDLSKFSICVLSGTICREGNPNELTAQNCYNHSAGTFTWNLNTSLCTACQAKIIINNDNIGGYLIRIILVIISMN